MDYAKKSDYIENKKVKKMRIFIAVLYFLQFINTLLFPFAEEFYKEGDVLKGRVIWASNSVLNLFSSNNTLSFGMNVIFSLFVILPIVCFFFFVIDKKSNIKCVVSFVTCILCCYLIAFELVQIISVGSIFALILYVLIMFCTTILLLATSSYNKEIAMKNN